MTGRRLAGVIVLACALAVALLPASTAAQVYSRGASDLQTVPFGATSGRVQTTLTTSIANVCTAADTVETDLWSYTLPANSLVTDGRGVRIIVSVSFAANANGKALRTYFGAINLASSSAVVGGTPNGVPYLLNLAVLRTATAAQVVFGTAGSNLVSYTVPVGTAAVDMTAAIVLRVTGQNTVATAGDICTRGIIVETIG